MTGSAEGTGPEPGPVRGTGTVSLVASQRPAPEGRARVRCSTRERTPCTYRVLVGRITVRACRRVQSARLSSVSTALLSSEGGVGSPGGSGKVQVCGRGLPPPRWLWGRGDLGMRATSCSPHRAEPAADRGSFLLGTGWKGLRGPGPGHPCAGLGSKRQQRGAFQC